MLEHLFGSRTRVKLLGLFLRQPNEPLFVREMTRKIDTQINAVRREIANLVRLGLLIESTTVEDPPPYAKKQPGLKKKFYQVNPSFPLLPEITNLFIKAQLMLERRLDQDIVKLGDVRYLAFLGFFIGKAPAPVDVFVVGDLDQKALSKLIAETEKQMGQEINFSLMSMDEFLYRRDMTDKFLYAVLEAPKNVVVDRLSERPKA
jgi:predicted transcriptional regulator